MKKQICMLLCGSVAAVSSVFGGEFKMEEFRALMKAKNVAGMKQYVEANKPTSTADTQKMYQYYAAKFVAMEPKVENYFTTIDQLVDQSKELTEDQKLFVKAHLYNLGWWFAQIDYKLVPTRVEMMKPIANDNQKFNSIVNNPKVHPQVAWNLFRLRSDFESNIVRAAKFNPQSAFAYAAAKKLNKQVVGEIINIIVNDPTFIKQPSTLNSILTGITKLNNPAYDESVKTLLIVLNRQCYPKIQVNDQWKQAVVQLQLIMKSYGL